MPLTDMHCHLFAGIDDGPCDLEQALIMCQMAVADGIEAVAAVAHQNNSWPNSAEQIRLAASQLTRMLADAQVPLRVFATGEVMLRHDLLDTWNSGDLLSVGDAGRYLLIEFPHGVYVNLQNIVRRLIEEGVRPILAHAERSPPLLYDINSLRELIQAGCLIQVNADSLTRATDREFRTALRQLFESNAVHMLGSDGHSPLSRPPVMSAARQQIVSWIGEEAADNICWKNGLQILEGHEFDPPEVVKPRRRWFPRFW